MQGMRKALGALAAVAASVAMLAGGAPVALAADTAGDIPIDAAHFPDEGFRECLKGPFGADNDGNGILSPSERNTATELSCNSLSLKSLAKGLEWFPNLTSLETYVTGITAIDVSHNPKLTRLSMYRTEQLASVDVSHNPELKILAIPDAKLTSLDVSKNPKLQNLDVSANRMTSLDVSHNPELSSLYVGSAYTYDNSIVGQNRITSLDVSKNPKLGYLDVSSNRLTSLDVSNNPELIRLDVSGNKLSQLDVSRNTKLTYFNAANTAISSMDLSKHTGLVQADGARSGACEAEVGFIMDGSPLVALQLPAKYSGMVYTYDGCADVDAQNAVIKPAVYEGGYYGSTFDLSSVASWFDGTKVSDLKGAKLEGAKLTGLSGTAEVTYTYDTGAAKAPLKAHLKLTRLGDTQVSFRDVTDKTPHADDITWLASTGISTGWKESDGSYTFRGMSSVKRQDMAAFLYRLAGSPSFDESKVRNPFRDVTKSTPHYKEIMWLYSTGISTGWKLADGSFEFRGMNSVVRQDMAAFLHRLADYQKAKPTLGKDVLFSDVNGATPHSADIAWLAKTGVTTGWKEKDGTTTFRGMSTVKRQDMAAFLHRMKTNVLK